MRADEPSTDRMPKLNVRVPDSLLDHVDELSEQRGYTDRSEAVRDALRDWIETPESAAALFGNLEQPVGWDGTSTDESGDERP